MDKIKKIIMYILIFFPVSNGFSVTRAKEWILRIRENFKYDKNHNIKEKIWAYRHGYMPEYVERFNITSKKINDFVSEKDYFYSQPINGIYRKWIANKVISRKVFSPFKENLQQMYYQISTKNDRLSAFPLDDCKDKTKGKKGLLKLIKTEGDVFVTSPRQNRNVRLSYKNGKYYFGDKTTEDERKLFDYIIEFDERAVIAEYIEVASGFKNRRYELGDTVRIMVVNDKGIMPKICEAFLRVGIFETFDDKIYKPKYTEEENYYESNDENTDGKENIMSSELIFRIDLDTGSFNEGEFCKERETESINIKHAEAENLTGQIPYWENIKKTVIEMSMHVPQLEFFAVDLVITKQGFKCIRFVNVPEYPKDRPFSRETVKFLQKKVDEKRILYSSLSLRIKRGAKRIKLKTRKCFAALFFPAGLKPYLSIRWIKEVSVDLFTNKDVNIRTKLWAYRHGFLSYRIPQYGITKENHLDYISDFEYKWLRHINGNYRVLFEDKITIKYVVNDFNECFPEYYYHIKTDNGENVVIPMMDCPNKYGRSFEDIFSLAKEKGVLALKPDEGSHGDGFYKLSYEDGQYYLNFDKVEEEDIAAILKNPDNQYIVTEYINNHPQFKEIYDGAVNTIRMIVFKTDGKTPEIGNAYMRFGSKATGAVDNMGAGGMFVQVDIETGRYGNAKIITHNSIQDCPYHPDSGVLIEGVIPHWEQIKETILALAGSIRQLEYFGFDIAVTEDGIKLPEINRFPDYPKIEQLSMTTMKYLLHKLEQKKHLYGYDVKPCRKLIHLPKR